MRITCRKQMLFEMAVRIRQPKMRQLFVPHQLIRPELLLMKDVLHNLGTPHLRTGIFTDLRCVRMHHTDPVQETAPSLSR